MADSTPKRKLAAIMFTDMVGYTSLMQEDEDKARRLIQRHRDLVKPHVDKHGGEIIQYVGDGTFCRFDSAIEAVNSALEIQKVLELEPEINLRIGIHVGDVVVDGDEVYGDGVNVASRLEPLADTGEICISGAVYQEIRNKPNLKPEYLGEKNLKNVLHPIKVYSVRLENRDRSANRSVYVLKEEKQNEIAGSSIAVLPFVNMSSDRENEYFGDGLAEELINALTRITNVRVAARTSAFAFKNRNEDIREIGKKLSVDTLLEGSVRKQGNNLRITVQLVNVKDGYHLWSEKYDRELENVFEIQDEITENIIEALKVVLSDNEKQMLSEKRFVDIKAYDFYLRGLNYLHLLTKKNLYFALKMFKNATEIDPNYALAHASIAQCYCWLYAYWESTEENLAMAEEASRKSLELGPDLAETHVSRGYAASLKREYADAEVEFQEAININPRLFDAYYLFARTCWVQGKLDDAVELVEKAINIRPEEYQAKALLANVLRGLGEDEKASLADKENLIIIMKHIELNPDDVRALYLGAIAQITLGNKEIGLEWANNALAAEPDDPGVIYNVACCYSLLGKNDGAIDLLEKAIDKGFGQKEWIENDSDLDPLRDDPKFRLIIEKLE